jgi:hypothetical protein
LSGSISLHSAFLRDPVVLRIPELVIDSSVHGSVGFRQPATPGDNSDILLVQPGVCSNNN